MKVIGIVGGVASGKTLVAKIFQQLGAAVLDADKAGHDVLRTEPVKAQLRDLWGDSIFKLDGEIDRSIVAGLVFGSDDQSNQRLKQLERITHPLIRQRLEFEIERLKAEGAIAAVLDAPVMVKAGWFQLCDRIVFVDADVTIRRQRTSQRGWSGDELDRREKLQAPLEEKRHVADAEIDNSGGQDATFDQVQKLWSDWIAVPDADR